MRASTCLLFALPVLAAACGNGAVGPGYAPPYATLNGAIISSSVSTPAEVRVALVWERHDGSSTSLRTAQELGVRTDFPVHFQLDIDQLPPEEAMNTLTADEAAKYCVDPSVRYAYGTVVVYEDLDGDGKLALIPVDATSAPDKVLGAPKGVTIIYTEGNPAFTPGCTPAPPAAGLAFQPGFNLVSEPISPSYTGPAQLLPLTTEIDIALTGDPSLSHYLCQPGSGSSVVGAVCTDPSCYPPPGTEHTCSADNQSYDWTICASTPSLCGAFECRYGVAALPPGAPFPPGWPCTPLPPSGPGQ